LTRRHVHYIVLTGRTVDPDCTVEMIAASQVVVPEHTEVPMKCVNSVSRVTGNGRGRLLYAARLSALSVTVRRVSTGSTPTAGLARGARW
jgi:hypothetical protein